MVARAVHKALSDRRPRVRYAVGADSTLVPIAKRLLPDWLALRVIRDHFGVPIGVSSGYRSKALNKAIGGSKYSQHMIGEALDIDADIYGKVTNAEIFNFVKNNLEWDQMIWEFGDDEEPNWVHISYKAKGQNRKQLKRAYRDERGVHYKVI